MNARLNADRFAPVQAKRLRFTILATNNLEPCVDELEVFNTAGVNVALAAAGTKVTSSGDTIVADRHELRFVNDGHYGNSRSWMSNENGKGQVELEFAEEQSIDRVVWGRDREGKFADRLAIDYRIEVADASGRVEDRRRCGRSGEIRAGDENEFPISSKGLSEADAKEAKRLQAERNKLKEQIAAAAIGQTAFAGTFRTPDVIHLLTRGDPEQPKDEVSPAVPSALGRCHASAGRRGTAATTRARRLDRQSAESAHGSRDGEPHLAGALRHRPGGDRQRLRPQWHQADASRIARLAGVRIHSLRLVGQAHAPAHRAVGHLSAVLTTSTPSRPPKTPTCDCSGATRRGVSTARRFAIRCSP